MTIRKNKQRGTWMVDRKYRLSDGPHRVRETYPTKAEAEKALAELEAKIARLTAADTLGMLRPDAAPIAAGTTLSAWWDSCRLWYAQHRRETTLRRYETLARLHLLPRLGQRPLAALTPAEIEATLTVLLGTVVVTERRNKEGAVTRPAKTMAPATVRQIAALLHHLLARAVRLGVLQAHPMRNIEPITVKPAEQAWTFLSFDEADAYLGAAAKEAPEWRTYFTLAIRGGLRRGELMGLRWENVDLARRHVTIRHTRTRAQKGDDEKRTAGRVVEGAPKSGKERSVGLTPSAAEALKALPSRWGYVCAGLNPDDEKPVHKRILKAAGIERHVRPHDLRHTWASHLAMRGVPLATIQQLGGWSSYAMVLRYAHLSKESVLSAVDCLEPVAPPKVQSGATEGQQEGPEP